MHENKLAANKSAINRPLIFYRQSIRSDIKKYMNSMLVGKQDEIWNHEINKYMK